MARWLRFLLGGALNTLCTYTLFLFFNLWLGYQWAYFLAYLSGILLAFFINSLFVFRVKTSWSKFFRYPGIYVAQYFFSALVLAGLVELLRIPESIAPLITVACVIPLTYFMNKLILHDQKQTP